MTADKPTGILPTTEIAHAPLELAKKLCKIMGELHRIPKKGYNEYHKYEYVTEADVTDALRGLLADNGVMLFTNVEDATRQGEISTVWVSFTLMDIDSGEYWTSRYPGEGKDANDKGIPKAITAATKYFLLKAFMLSAGDDPENDGAGSNNKGGRNNGRSGSRQQPHGGSNGSSGSSGPALPDLPTTAIAVRVTEGNLSSKNTNGKAVMLFKGKAVYEETGETFPLSGWREQGQFLKLAMDQKRPVIVTVEKSERFGEYQVKQAEWPKDAAPSHATDDKGQGKGQSEAGSGKAPENKGAEPKLAFRQEVARLRNAGFTDGQLSPIVHLCTGDKPFDESPTHIQELILAVCKFLPDRVDAVTAALKSKRNIHTWDAGQAQGFSKYLTNQLNAQQPSAPATDSSDEVQL